MSFPSDTTVFARAVGAPPEGAYSVLLIEDNFFHSALIKMILTKAGFQITAAITELEAFSALERMSPDIIIADWDSDGVDGDGLDGPAIVERIRRRCPDLLETPAILMTNREITESIRMTQSMQGFRWILQKPIVAQSLPRLIGRTLSEAKVRSVGADYFNNLMKAAQLIEGGRTVSGMYLPVV